jgi:Cd2+/Zn2+-exporting ATPase
MKKLLRPIPKIIVGASIFLGAIIIELLSVPILPTALYIAALVLLGYDVFVSAARGILRRDLLDEKFLMSIASIGAMIVGEYNEGVAIMLFFLIGETFEQYAVRRSRASIKSLMELCPDTASVITEDGEEIFDCEDIEVGSTIVIRPGERVPLDCVIISGTADADTSAVTGESAHRSVSVGDPLDSGVVIYGGMLQCRTTRPLEESCAHRILELVENATDNKSNKERFITAFSRVYTPVVVSLALLLAVILPLGFGVPIPEAIYRALIFLVISCPCALVISVPMAFFGGIGSAARRGILFKGANVFSPIAKARRIAFDKTGTLTKASFEISRVETDGIGEEELLALVRRAEYSSNHPVAEAIKRGGQSILPPDEAEEIAGEGVRCVISGDEIFVGNLRLMKRIGVSVRSEEKNTVYCAINRRFAGLIVLSDTVKDEAEAAISSLRALGVGECIMISGDRGGVVKETAESVGIDTYFSELTPEDKYNKVKEYMSDDTPFIFVGDGINDSPSLAISDVGIAMGAIGQDSAIEAADVVIMSDDLNKIPEAIKIARKTNVISTENIVLALGVKLCVMLLGALGIANMWLAVFADVGVAVLAILNSLRMIISGKAGK